MQYKKGRKCKDCKAPLSIYNPYHLCWKCVRVFCDKRNLPFALFENEYSRVKTENKVGGSSTKTQVKVSEVCMRKE